jgi:hypothetical protein
VGVDACFVSCLVLTCLVLSCLVLCAGLVTTLAGSVDGYVLGVGTSAMMRVRGVSADMSGNVVVATNALNRVLKIDPSGELSLQSCLVCGENCWCCVVLCCVF